MPLFRYKAVAPGGAVSTGELSAANEAEILDRLRDQGLMPMQVAPVTGALSDAAPARAARAPRRRWFESRRVTSDQLMALTRELATLLRAGLPLDRALETLIGLAPTPAVNALLQGLRDEVRGGKALSQDRMAMMKAAGLMQTLPKVPPAARSSVDFVKATIDYMSFSGQDTTEVSNALSKGMQASGIS